ncbi:exocyst complex component exo70 [Vanrija albida]|uniref:Exocyst complex protein EXO70 n=1 Tax=Vanrija albida TaxID=181172 RepID=A0ABR3Q4Z6_9TREE
MTLAPHESGLSRSFAVEDNTDLALLDQHLLKTNTLTKHMTTILHQLDTRLGRLDKSIGKLGIREITRQSSNLDTALELLTGTRPSSTKLSHKASYGGSSVNSHAGANGNGSRTASSPGHQRGLSSSRTFGDLAPEKPAAKEATTPPVPSISVMERGRAVPRPDVVPRWATETPTPTSTTSSTTRTRVTTPQTNTAATTPSQPAWTPNASSDLPSPGGARAIVARGPDIMSIGEYFGALEVLIADLEHMNQGLAEGRGGTREQGVAELSRVIENGFGSAEQLLVKLVRDTLPRPFDAATLADSPPSSAQAFYPQLTTIIPLSTRLVALVDGNTPKAREVLAPVLNNCISDIAAIRGDWIRRSLSSLSARIDEVDGGGSWEGRGGEKVKLVMRLWESFLVAADAEASVAQHAMPGDAGQALVTFTLVHALTVVTSTMNQVVAQVKRSLSAQTLVMLDLFSCFTGFQPRYENKMASIVGQLPEGRDIVGALNGPIQILRGLALRSFPERLVDIRAPSRSTTISATIDDTTHSTLAFLEALPSFGPLVEGLLRSGGSHERTWLMGMKDHPSPARNAAEEGGTLNLYAADTLGTLLIHLDQQAKTMRRPVSSTYLLNNLSYIRNTTSSFNADIIGPAAEDMMNRHFREAKTQYIGDWQALVQTLSIQAQSRFPGGSTDKQSAKESAAAFFEKLVDLEYTCRQHPLSRQDIDLRDRIGAEVTELVASAYQSFWAKAHGKYDKYLKYSPEEIQRRVQAVFR